VTSAASDVYKKQIKGPQGPFFTSIKLIFKKG